MGIKQTSDTQLENRHNKEAISNEDASSVTVTAGAEDVIVFSVQVFCFLVEAAWLFLLLVCVPGGS